MKNKFRSDIHPGKMAIDKAGNICRVVSSGNKIGTVKVVYAEDTPFETHADKPAHELSGIPFTQRQMAIMGILAYKAFEFIKIVESDYDVSLPEMRNKARQILKNLKDLEIDDNAFNTGLLPTGE